MNAAETITRYGADMASDAELLSVIFSEPSATIHEWMAEASLAEVLVQGSANLKIGALAEVIRRSTRATEHVKLTCPRAASAYLMPKAVGLAVEQFGLVALNAKGEIIGEAIIGQGTCTAIAISPREVFRRALALGAHSVLVWHNHPSGDPTPSAEDRLLTKCLRTSGESLGVPLADHIILGQGRYHSFRAAEGWGQQGGGVGDA